MTTNTIEQSSRMKKRPLRLGIDVPLLVCVLILLAIGLLFVYSASWEFAVQLEKVPSYFLSRQLMFTLLGGGAAIVAFFLDYHRLQKYVIWLVIITLTLLAIVAFFYGETRLGARRSLFQGSFQPSEMAKLVIIIYLSFWLNSKKQVLNTISLGLVPLLLVLITFCGLILLQPDLSAAATIFVLGGLLFFLGGAEINQIVKVLGLALIGGLMVMLLHPTGQERISEFLMGIRDPIQGSYHVVRSIEAIIKGGLFGVGIGKSSVKFTGLPVAPTDSIFAVIAEEKGLLGVTAVILLYIIILWRGLTIANRAPDHLGKMLASGITIWIFLEAMINICVMVNLLPFAGNALPLISYGGSSLVTILAGMGMIMGVARITIRQKEEQEGRPLNAVVDLRRDDGWRNLPRPRRSAGIG